MNYDTGSTGYDGIIGNTGTFGDFIKDTGPTGTTGVNNNISPTGPTGFQGIKGNDYTGPTGPTGYTGVYVFKNSNSNANNIYYNAGVLTLGNTTPSTTTSSGTIVVSGGLGLINNNINVGNIFIQSKTTALSNNTSTGSLVVSGGVGIVGNINITGNVYVSSNSSSINVGGVLDDMIVQSPYISAACIPLANNVGINNTFIGANITSVTSTTSYHVGIIGGPLSSNTTNQYSTYIGYTTSINNFVPVGNSVYLGYNTYGNTIITQQTVSIGYNSNILGGSGAGAFVCILGSTCIYSCTIGYLSNSSFNRSVAIGTGANTSFSNLVVCIGSLTAYYNQSTVYNVGYVNMANCVLIGTCCALYITYPNINISNSLGIGAYSLVNPTIISGIRTALGAYSGFNNVPCTVIGAYAGYNTLYQDCISIGYYAGSNNPAPYTTNIGYYAGIGLGYILPSGIYGNAMVFNSSPLTTSYANTYGIVFTTVDNLSNNTGSTNQTTNIGDILFSTNSNYLKMTGNVLYPSGNVLIQSTASIPTRNFNTNSTSSGALFVRGGMNIGGNVVIQCSNIAGNIIIGNNTSATGYNTGFLMVQGGTSVGGDTWISGNIQVSSSLNNGQKTFIIQNPVQENKYLVHACIEGPEAGVYYRGEGEITNGEYTIIALPEYTQFFYNFNIQITQIYDGKHKKFRASRIEKNRFTVYGENGSFFWLVMATRSSITVEPLRSEVKVQNVGPYAWIE
jgi:hypothetical protein